MLKKIFYLGSILIISLSCTKNEDAIEYPLSFTFDRVVFSDFHYFVIENGVPQAIEASGTFLAYEPQATEELSMAQAFFPIDEFVLLSESEVQLIANDPSNPVDTVLTYTQSDDVVRILLDPIDNLVIELEYDQTTEQLRYCLASYFYSFINTLGEQDYGAFETAPCTTSAAEDFATSIMTGNSLQTNDSIALNYSYLVFE